MDSATAPPKKSKAEAPKSEKTEKKERKRKKYDYVVCVVTRNSIGQRVFTQQFPEIHASTLDAEAFIKSELSNPKADEEFAILSIRKHFSVRVETKVTITEL